MNVNDEKGLEFISENQAPKNKLKILELAGVRTTAEGESQLNFYDKKRWLVFEDFWAGHITEVRAQEMLSAISDQQEKAAT